MLSLSPHEVLFREGEQGDRMYVVLEGRLDILVGDNVIETASEGESSAKWPSSTTPHDQRP